jgi:lipopolysaccharide/colanic/teichoic acid biosynthesis glycosyltransferase
MIKWEKLPESLKNDAVRPYYDILKGKTGTLVAKRAIDIGLSAGMIVLLSPVFGVVAVMIKKDDGGPVFFRQKRVTRYGREFKIIKFRTMVVDADKIGSGVTTDGDPRITGIGATLRKTRLDEIPQLFNIIKGDMTFVGTRPELPKYVEAYTDEMKATLLLRAGVTSDASILYKDESRLIGQSDDPDKTYIEKVLPEKMKYNLKSIKDISLLHEFGVMFKTIGAVLK